MPRPRKSLISLDETPFYHCVSRCVRRAFLCGKDNVSGKSFEHRKQWVENRLLLLAKVFAIDICAYAVMSNHTHVVLCVDKSSAKSWSTEEVLRRWHKLHKGTYLTRQYIDVEERRKLSKTQIEGVISIANIYRRRLYDISWFMRLLNEHIARKANKEDDCTGRFWEGRFKSQALLDDAAVIACMAYVDLNPLRTGKVKTPESAGHTSIKRRIRAAKNNQQPRQLLPFIGYTQQSSGKGLPYRLDDYLRLIDVTGRQYTVAKPGTIPANCEPILRRTGLDHVNWTDLVDNIENHFSSNISLAIAKKKLTA